MICMLRNVRNKCFGKNIVFVVMMHIRSVINIKVKMRLSL